MRSRDASAYGKNANGSSRAVTRPRHTRILRRRRRKEFVTNGCNLGHVPGNRIVLGTTQKIAKANVEEDVADPPPQVEAGVTMEAKVDRSPQAGQETVRAEARGNLVAGLPARAAKFPIILDEAQHRQVQRIDHRARITRRAIAHRDKIVPFGIRPSADSTPKAIAKQVKSVHSFTSRKAAHPVLKENS